MATLRDMLVERGVLSSTGAKADPEPAEPTARAVKVLPGVLDVFIRDADQEPPAPLSEIDELRQRRLELAAAGAGPTTAAQRHEAARAKARAAGLYRR